MNERMAACISDIDDNIDKYMPLTIEPEDVHFIDDYFVFHNISADNCHVYIHRKDIKYVKILRDEGEHWIELGIPNVYIGFDCDDTSVTGETITGVKILDGNIKSFHEWTNNVYKKIQLTINLSK